MSQNAKYSILLNVIYFQKMAKWSSQNSGKFPDPWAKLKFDKEEKKKDKKKKKQKKEKADREKENVLKQIDPNLNKVMIWKSTKYVALI